jgi:hypothetical protein
MKSSKIIRLLFIIESCIIMLCAHQVPPSGGPDDKTPPSVLSASPPAGTVNVPKKSAVVFTFTEWVNPQNADRSLSVFPALPDGVKITVSGRKIIVKPKTAFSDSTTYHIVFNTSLSDLHGNSIGTPYQHYFSTGPSIDSGRVFGCVLMGDVKGGQPKVALYTRAAGKGDTVYFGMPSYLTQTDSFGTFSFDNIHRGTYEILAFADANSNNRLDPTGESVFAPVQKTIALTRTAGPLVLSPVVCDTTTRHIATLSPVSPTCLAGEWVGGTTLPDSLYDVSWRVEAVESARVIAIRRYIPVFHTRRFLLALADTFGLAPFRLVYTKQSPLLFGKGAVLRDTIRFNGVAKPDTVPPLTKGYDPKTNADLKPVVRLFWSRPVRAGCAQWPCMDTLKNKVDFLLFQGFGDTTTFTAGRALAPGMNYAINMPDSLFKDISGNSPRDSLGIVITFTTIDEKDICFRMSGGASCLKGDSLRVWRFMPLGKQTTYISKDSAGQFRFDSLPAGKGRLGFFIDNNRDNLPSGGSLVPWMLPEQYRIFPDTIEARARWEVEGITVPAACEMCAPKTTPKPNTPAPEKKK